MVRVIGAQVIALSTSIAASRVMTHTGRRPAGEPRSAQTMSPRATTPVRCGARGGSHDGRILGDPPVRVLQHVVCLGFFGSSENRSSTAPKKLRAVRSLLFSELVQAID